MASAPGSGDSNLVSKYPPDHNGELKKRPIMVRDGLANGDLISMIDLDDDGSTTVQLFSNYFYVQPYGVATDACKSGDVDKLEDVWRHKIGELLPRNVWNMNSLRGLRRRNHRFDPLSLRKNDAEKAGVVLCTGLQSDVKCHTQQQIYLHLDAHYEVVSVSDLFTLMKKEKMRRSLEETLIGMLVCTRVDKNKVAASESFSCYEIIKIDWVPKDGRSTWKDYGDVFPGRSYRPEDDIVQPKLIVVPARHPHENTTSNRPVTLIRLDPEACDLVGMMNDFRCEPRHTLLEREREKHSRKLDVSSKLRHTLNLKQLINSKLPKTKQDEFTIADAFVPCGGRLLAKEVLEFGLKSGTAHVLSKADMEKVRVVPVSPDNNNEWMDSINEHELYNPVQMGRWAVIYPSPVPTGFKPYKLQRNFDHFESVCTALGFKFIKPRLMVEAGGAHLGSYAIAFNNLKNLDKTEDSDYQFLLIIIPSKNKSLQLEIFKHFSVKLGIIVEFLTTKDIEKQEVMDVIAKKLMIRLNVKLGGEPWRLRPNPQISPLLDELMIVGIDMGRVVADIPGDAAPTPSHMNSCIYGALVASTNSAFTKYYSTTFKFDKFGEVGNVIKIQMLKCLKAYRKNNRSFPRRIICYRDSVSDGDLADVREGELDQIIGILPFVYKQAKREPPELAYITVDQNTVTRIYTKNQNRDPAAAPPGTVVDQTITLPTKTDFFLISERPRHGITMPVHYNVLHAASGFNLHALEQLTYHFCHLSFDQAGANAIPTPCQHAYNLVTLYMDLKMKPDEEFHPSLENVLHLHVV